MLYIPKQNMHDHLNPNYSIFSHIKNLINNISSKKSSKLIRSEINFLISKNRNSQEAEKYMFIVALKSLESKELNQPKQKISAKQNFIFHQLTQYSQKEFFIYYFGSVVQIICQKEEYFQTIQRISKQLKLTSQIQVILGLSMVLSQNDTVYRDGIFFLKKALEQLKKQIKSCTFPQKIYIQLIFVIKNNPQLCQMQNQIKFLVEHNNSNELNIKPLLYNPKIHSNMNQILDIQLRKQTKPPQIKKVQLLKELSPQSTYNVQTLKIIFSNHKSPLTEHEILDCLLMMSQQGWAQQTSISKISMELFLLFRKQINSEEFQKLFKQQNLTQDKLKMIWNVQNFIHFCLQNIVNLKWNNVILSLDRPNLKFSSLQSFTSLIKYLRAKRVGNKNNIPSNLIFSTWANKQSQVEFLTYFIKYNKSQLCYQIDPKIQMAKIQNISNYKITPDMQIWYCIQFVTLLVQLSDSPYYNRIKQMFQLPLIQYSQILLLTLSQCRPKQGGPLLDDLFTQLFSLFLPNHTNYIKLLQTVWQNNQQLLISAICEFYKQDNQKQGFNISLSRVLDIAQNIKDSLISLTNWNDYNFSTALGILAGKREFLHFEKWVLDRLKYVPNQFLFAILNYINENVFKPIKEIHNQYGISHLVKFKEEILQKSQLSKELLMYIFESSLRLPRNKLTKRNSQVLQKIYRDMCAYFPETSQAAHFPDQVEKQADKFFNKIYKQQISIEEAIDQMIKQKSSIKQSQKQLFAGIITFLFSELRFHDNYPQKELNLTAKLFVGIINNNLIDKKLIYVFQQFLKKSFKANNKRFQFGLLVIKGIESKWVQQAELCQSLFEINQLITKDPQLLLKIYNKLEANNLKHLICAQLKQKLTKQIEQMNQKKQIRTVLQESCPQKEKNTQLFCYQEFNHDVDILVDSDKSNNIKISQVIKDNLLKTLNEAILYLENDKSGNPKIIFIAKQIIQKTVNQAKQRQTPSPNPVQQQNLFFKWLAFIVVFKKLIKIESLRQIQILKEIVKQFKMFEKYSLKIIYKVFRRFFSLTKTSVNDKNIKIFQNMATWVSFITLARDKPIHILQLNIKQILLHSKDNKARIKLNLNIIGKLLEYATYSKVFKQKNPWLYSINQILRKIQTQIGIPPVIHPYIQHLTIQQITYHVKIDQTQLGPYIAKGLELKKIVSLTVDSAVNQIISPVIMRAVTIALITTKQLILNDFAFQPDQKKLLKGAHLMIQNLSGSLALVTCRQPLRATMTKNIEKLLDQQTEVKLSDQDINKIMNKTSADNLDLGCAIVKHTVIKKALQRLNQDQSILEAIEKRKKAKQQGQIFKNEAYMHLLNIIPERNRGPLQIQELKIYDDFSKKIKTDSQEISTIQKEKYEYDNENFKKIHNKMMKQISNEEVINSTIKSVKLYPNSSEKIRDYFMNIVIDKDQMIEGLIYYFSELEKEAKLNVNHLIQILNFHIQNYPSFIIQQITIKIIKILTKHQDIQQSKFCQLQKKLINSQNKCNSSHPLINQLKKKYYQECLIPEQIKKNLEALNNLSQASAEYEELVQKKLMQWLRISTDTNQISSYFNDLEQSVIFESSQNIKQFFTLAIEKSVQTALNSDDDLSLNYSWIDSICKFIVIFFKTVNKKQEVFQTICDVILFLITKYHEGKSTIARPFNQRPFFKIIYNLLYDIKRTSYNFTKSDINFFITVVAKLLNKLQPLYYPGFTFAWMNLISNKYFLPEFLQNESSWPIYKLLISDLLKFFKEQISEQTFEHQYTRTLYCGLLRIFLVILKDFSDFLSQYCYILIEDVGSIYVQVRNIILSATPKSMTNVIDPAIIKERKQLQQMCELNPKFYKFTFEQKLSEIGMKVK